MTLILRDAGIKLQVCAAAYFSWCGNKDGSESGGLFLLKISVGNVYVKSHVFYFVVIFTFSPLKN